jgi:hypothetical protein
MTDRSILCAALGCVVPARRLVVATLAALALACQPNLQTLPANQAHAPTQQAPDVTAAGTPLPQTVQTPPSLQVSQAPQAPKTADFGNQFPSPDARYVADWIAGSGDNGKADFLIVDKRQALVYVFDAQARLRDSTPALLGSARGDDSVPGIGERPLAQVKPEERTTPAGRFVAEAGRNMSGEDIVWIDYDSAVSMHRVRNTNASEKRLQRLASPSIDDNRISYGCINLPVAFYERVVKPLFAAKRLVVYVLPEVKPVRQMFGMAQR